MNRKNIPTPAACRQPFVVSFFFVFAALWMATVYQQRPKPRQYTATDPLAFSPFTGCCLLVVSLDDRPVSVATVMPLFNAATAAICSANRPYYRAACYGQRCATVRHATWITGELLMDAFISIMIPAPRIDWRWFWHPGTATGRRRAALPANYVADCHAGLPP